MFDERYTTANPSAIKRFVHRARLERAVRLLDPRPGDRILDYGTGDGLLLRLLHRTESRARLCGFEPHHRAEALAGTAGLPAVEGIHDRPEPIDAFRPTKIACLEVLEHLRPDDCAVAVDAFRRWLEPGGWLVVSVPIEIGPASLAKNVLRKLLGQPHRGLVPRNVLLALLGLTRRIERDPDERYIASHIGFDHREVAALLRARGFAFRRRYSPFPGLGPLVNSQVLFVGQPAAET